MVKSKLCLRAMEVRSDRPKQSFSKHRGLQYLPANSLIGELFHPIELLLHFRSLASLAV